MAKKTGIVQPYGAGKMKDKTRKNTIKQGQKQALLPNHMNIFAKLCVLLQ
jgi:hypothetical protein